MSAARRRCRFSTALLFVAGMSNGAAVAATQAERLARGEYLIRAAGCVACHTDSEGGGSFLAGGRALVTPFGTFYAPNITADPEHGLGTWSEHDFVRALRHGRRPDGAAYYPAFPYTAYSGVNDRDIEDLWAYLQSVPSVAQPDRTHDLAFPFRWRLLAWAWQWLFFEPQIFHVDPSQDEVWNRVAIAIYVRSLSPLTGP